MEIKCYGEVTSETDTHYVFDWLGGDIVNLPKETLDGEIHIGDWCDMIIVFEKGFKCVSSKLIKISGPMTQITDEEFYKLWDALPKAKLWPID